MSHQNDKKKELTNGLVVTVFEDVGPTNIFNSSPLEDDEAFNMAIKTLTMIGTTSVLDEHEVRSYGPIPTPREPYNTIAFMFMLRAEDSLDERIAKAGRLVVFWIITTNPPALRKYTDLIKLMVQRTLRVYEIKTDKDLYNEDILNKINNQLQIVDTGKDYYYVTKKETVEAFVNLSMLDVKAPVLIVNSETKKIQLLFRDEHTSPIERTKIRSVVGNFRDKMPKGSLFRIELVSDPVSVHQILTSSGLEIQQDLGTRYRIRVSDKLEFGELDEFFSIPIKKIQNILSVEIINAFDEKKTINLNELSAKTGLTTTKLADLINRALKSNVLINASLKDNLLEFS